MKRTLFCLSLLITLSTSCKPADNGSTGSETNNTIEATQAQKPPKDVVKEFLDLYVVERDVEQAYQYFTTEDKAVKSQAQYVKEKTQTQWEPMLKKHSSYTIKDSEVKPNSAKFTVDLKMVDVMQLVKEAMGDKTLLQLAAMKKEDADKLAEKSLAKYKDGKAELPMTTIEETINLVKENGDWKIANGWAEKEKLKDVQNPVLQIGEEGTLMSSPEKGDVLLKANSVKFSTAGAPDGSVFCIINVTISNKMKGQFTEKFITATSTASILTGDGSKYNQEFFHPDKLKTTQIDSMNPLNPDKSTTGDLVFPVDKKSTDLKLTFDAGHSPIPENFDYEQDRSLTFKLGNIAI